MNNSDQPDNTGSTTANPLSTPWVVIPTYNEIDNIAKMIRELYAQDIPNLHVLIVDDNSPDGTAPAVHDLQQEFPTLQIIVRPTKAGLGPAYIHGFQHALKEGATSVVQMDADFSHSPADVSRLLAKLVDHDLVIGSRYSNGISVINWPLRRLLISIGGNKYASIITGLPFKDATGGFKAWRAKALETINFNTIDVDGYGFQIALTYHAWKKGLRIIEMPIVFTERREGQSKMNKAIVREAIWLVWRLRILGR